MKIGDLRELPQSISPGRDLWPAIEAGIREAEGGSRTAGRARIASRPPRPAWLAAGLAAAFALLAIGVWIGRSGLTGLPGAPRATPIASAESHTRTAGAMPVAFGPGPHYAEQRAALLHDLGARLAALPPESRAQVEHSLATIRRSIEELRAALGEDPGNVLLQELLVNAYQDEMRVLVTVNEAGRSSQEI